MAWNLREFTDEMPWREKHVTLLLIKPEEILQAQSKLQKLALLAEYDCEETDRFVAVWTGKWTSHAFEFPAELLLEWKEEEEEEADKP